MSCGGWVDWPTQRSEIDQVSNHEQTTMYVTKMQYVVTFLQGFAAYHQELYEFLHRTHIYMLFNLITSYGFLQLDMITI